MIYNELGYMILTCMVYSVLPNLQCFTEPKMFICSIHAGFTTQSHVFHAGDLQLVPVYY